MTYDVALRQFYRDGVIPDSSSTMRNERWWRARVRHRDTVIHHLQFGTLPESSASRELRAERIRQLKEWDDALEAGARHARSDIDARYAAADLELRKSIRRVQTDPSQYIDWIESDSDRDALFVRMSMKLYAPGYIPDTSLIPQISDPHYIEDLYMDAAKIQNRGPDRNKRADDDKPFNPLFQDEKGDLLQVYGEELEFDLGDRDGRSGKGPYTPYAECTDENAIAAAIRLNEIAREHTKALNAYCDAYKSRKRSPEMSLTNMAKIANEKLAAAVRNRPIARLPTVGTMVTGYCSRRSAHKKALKIDPVCAAPVTTAMAEYLACLKLYQGKMSELAEKRLREDTA